MLHCKGCIEGCSLLNAECPGSIQWSEFKYKRDLQKHWYSRTLQNSHTIGRPFMIHQLWEERDLQHCTRCEQGLNLRGETPLDFESNALTTRPSQPAACVWSHGGVGLEFVKRWEVNRTHHNSAHQNPEADKIHNTGLTPQFSFTHGSSHLNILSALHV